MAAKQLNPGSSFDIWFGVLFLFASLGVVDRLVGHLPRPGLGAPRLQPDAVHAFVYLGTLVVAALAFDMVRARTEKSRACCVVMGAFMAMSGSVVISFLSGFLCFLLGLVILGSILPEWALGWAFWLWMLVPVFLASYWSGWRYGAWGAFWGACAALLCLETVFLKILVDVPVGLSASNIAVAVLMLLLGAFAGTLGAARFQRSLAREAAATPSTAAESAHPAA